MPRYEYKVVPAPKKGLKGKGVKGPEARFSYAVQELMNGLSGYGWEFIRSETLPQVERAGLTGSTTEWRSVLVFRRPRAGDSETFEPELLPSPGAPEIFETDPQEDDAEAPTEDAEVTEDAPTDLPFDNGVEDTGEIKGIGASLAALASKRNAKKSED